MEVKINSEYEALLPKLSKEDYEALKVSIQTEGQHFPIIVSEEGTILDGHHRFRVCQELQLAGKFDVKQFSDPLLEKKFVIESNLLRRHLNTFQRAKLVLPLLEIEKELARRRQEHKTDNCAQYCAQSTSKKIGKPLTDKQKEARRIRDKRKREEKKKAGITRSKPKRATAITAKKARISRTTLEKAKEILEKGSEELKAKVENDKITISHAYRIIKRNESKAQLEQRKGSKEIQILQGDFQQASEGIQENSVDFIITDPPYGRDFLHLYGKLGQVANRILKPGGSLLVMTGQSYLPEVFTLLQQHLTYNWLVGCVSDAWWKISTALGKES